MDDSYVTKLQFDEYVKRADAEDTRQNRRLDALEENAKEIHELTVSVERMAVSMENMISAIDRQGKSIERQGARLEKIEMAPAEAHKNLKAAIATAVVGALTGAFITAILTLL